ncbi:MULTISPECIES: LacI family DNA-binding transcriptional regulator [Rhizobium]|nr:MULTISPECIES: LacI family DNA-binding transcriptional regulator [Rhizobium]
MLPDPAKKKVTMAQVAGLAGVHASTVSRALNPETRSMVVPEVVDKVLEAAKSLGYRVDPIAKSLRTGRSRMIGVLIPDISNTLFAPILSGINDFLNDTGYSVIVAEVGNDVAKQLELADRLVAHRIDGLVLGTVSRKDPIVDFCLDQSVPAVLVNRAETSSRLSAVISDDLASMQLAVEHLYELGHRRIGHIAGPPEHSTGYLRRRGFEFAASHLELKNTACEVASAYTRSEGAAAMDRLLDQYPDITGVAAANDLLALGAYDALAARGLSCPDDISIVGHNDMPLMDIVHPPLTTMRIGHREMGRQAAELLQQAIERRDRSCRNIVLPAQLVVRNSTARV